ncbi:MAG: hypothetical protein L6R37_007783 [Teloschistes peruensis]|nr:MAG: hypothetical protein L6R37_007783 [Teloschistes peruensis]
MTPRPALAFVSLILIAGAILLILLTLLGGAINKNPTNKFYFLEADTTGLGTAAATSRWTFWNVCSVMDGHNACPKVHAAYPFDPKRNFGTSDIFGYGKHGVARSWGKEGTGSKYYLETRFMFAFVLIGLFFAVCALFLSLLALCSRIGSFLSSALCSVALFFQTLTAALMTAAYVQGRSAFRSSSRTATLGKYNFGFMWAAVAALFLATLLECVGGVTGKKSSERSYTKRTGGGGRGFLGMGRKKSTRSRGSFIDPERQRRMEKEDDD